MDEALALLRWPDGRIGQFVQNRIASKAPTALIISPWRDVAASSEFRLFYKGGRMVGASQYHHSRVYPDMVSRKQELAAAIFVIAPQIGQALHMPDVVVDIELIPQARGALTMTLIELNPYLSITDPCLFSWASGGNFDGTLRVRHS
ncbi:hypothetical protein [Yoonia sp. 2307UL14-13]|uniref:hypothetical protein n=1 Tax=Yoonia sp. 2307UL14-13 TaxID=3126506 RepID=UPI0030A3FB4D